MNSDKQTAIMAPVFEGTRYLHHVCSECKGEIHLTQSSFGTIYFYELESDGTCKNIKFCPLCGSEIIRFSDEAIYEKPIDLKPLDIFADLNREYERKARWLYHCYISDTHRDQIDAILPLVKKADVSVSYQKAIDSAKVAKGFYGMRYHERKKLRNEFGEDTE